MQEVSCFHCNSIVHIIPNADRCSVCSEDLSQLLDTEYVSNYFYQRSNRLATDGNIAQALAEAERGLDYQQSSDLHLLAAILAQQLGQFDQMRQHVAEIPIGDILRPEAEWMLRSHQARQRAVREGAKMSSAYGLSTHAGQTNLEDVLGDREKDAHEARASSARAGFIPVIAFMLSMIVVVGAWWWLSKDSGPLSGIFANEAGIVESTPIAPAADAVETPDADAGAPILPTSGEQTEDIAPTLVPTASVPDNLVQKPEAAPELVDSDLRRVVIVPADIFDLATFLNETGNLELAALPIDARVQDDKLILQGIVHTDLQRRRLLASVQNIQGIGTVNAVDLLLRPAPTYTVQAGDTLWSIVFNIYGDVERMDTFYEFNTEVLPSRDAINVGMVLKVPPLD